MIEQFKNYLVAQGYRLSSMNAYATPLRLFLRWCDQQEINPKTASYEELLAFVDHCKSEGNDYKTIIQKLATLNHYYAFIGRSDHAVKQIKIKGERYKLPPVALSETDLMQLHQTFETYTPSTHRNRVMVGVLAHQGVTSSELEKLELADLKLHTGELIVPATAKTNTRILLLNPSQILELQTYVTEFRPALLQQRPALLQQRPALLQQRPAILKEANKQTAQLFVTSGQSDKLKNTLAVIVRKLKQQNPRLLDVKHLRSSRVTHWIRTEGLRKAQYMAGHRYVSSTERYATNELEELQELIEQYHPM
jgi:integrase/recombinase XerD